MKKLFRTMLCAALATAALCVSAFAADTVPAKQGDFYVEVNGEYVTFTDAVPKIKNDRSCLPFVAVFEQLGFAEKDMTWDGGTSTVTATKGDTTISLTIGKKQIALTKAGKTTVIDTDVAPYIEPSLSRTYVPFGLVADALGYKVGWDAKQGTVIIDDVDAILAANKETYTLMDKYMEYSRTFTEKNQQVKGSYSAYILTTSEMESSHGADKVTYSTNMVIDGTYAMTMAGSSQLQFTTDMTMDVETKWDGKDPGSANDNSEIGMELRGDLEKGTLYLQSPELASMMGQPGMANAWFKLDMKSMMAQAGVNYTDLIRASLSAKDQTFSQQLPEVLRSLTLNDASMTTRDTLAVLNALCADSAFQKSGSTYNSTLYLGEMGKVELSLYTKSGKVTGYGLRMEVNDSGTSLHLSANMADKELTVDLSLTSEEETGAMQMNMTMDGIYSAASEKPATEPASGAVIVDLAELLGSLLQE